MASQKILVDSKLYLNDSNIMEDVFVDYPRLCGCNLSVDRLSTALIVEVVSSKILVDIKLYSDSFNNRVTFVVIGSRLCGYNLFGERLSTILMIKRYHQKY